VLISKYNEENTMKKTPMTLLVAALLSAGIATHSFADNSEQSINIDVRVENDGGPFVVAELNGTKHEVQLSKAAMTDKEILKSEISHLPEALQAHMVNMFDHHQGETIIIENEDGGKNIIERVIKINGDDDDTHVMHFGSNKKMIIKTESHTESEIAGLDSEEANVFVFKTEFETDGEFNMSDLIVRLIKKQPLSDEQKQQIREALDEN
jgi:hypothetical protein